MLAARRASIRAQHDRPREALHAMGKRALRVNPGGGNPRRLSRTMRCAFLAALIVGIPAVGLTARAAQEKLTPEQFEADFVAFWDSVNRQYAYFDIKQTDWIVVREMYRPRARKVGSRAEFTGLLEHALEELYDSHTHLNTNTSSSPRLVPSGTDVWAEWRQGVALIVAVRPGSAAARAGLRPGMGVVSYNGAEISSAVDGRVGRSLRRPDPAARDWALRVILAGRHNEKRTLVVRSGKDERQIAIDDANHNAADEGKERGPLDYRRLPRDLGYIRLNDSLGRDDTIAAFDAALSDLKGTRGLILDLRDTPSGGNSSVARGIMGRLLDRERPYQKHVLPEEERETGIRRSWLELVTPRGPFAYTAPLVVLVDHWTGSMGEGTAIGLDGAGRGVIVGTRMAELLGAKTTETLPHTRIQVSFPYEKLYHINGTPREQYRPRVEVDLLQAANGAEDPILEAGIQTLEKQSR